MTVLAFLSLSGRLARLPFVVAVVTIYALSFVSQVLLSAPLTARLGVWGFALAQAVLIWAWIVVHVRRLRDCGLPTGLAIGVALVYAIEVVLVILLVWAIVESGVPRSDGAGQDANILTLFVFLYLLALLTGSMTMLGILQLWLIGFALLLFLPLIIALVFSATTAARPSVAPG